MLPRPQLAIEVPPMTVEPDKCPACGRGFAEESSRVDQMPALPNPGRDTPRNWVEQNLQKHLQTLDRLSGQLDELLQALSQGRATDQELLDQVETLRQSLKPRHGLCIDANCAPCRVHEEAIKEHVLLYVDWKVPGTVQKLEQARHRN